MVNIGRIPEKWAALTPRGDAVVDTTTGRRTSWAELDERVRRLANGLRGSRPDGLALQRGDRVAVLAKNSTEFQEIYYAAGRAGLVVQPLNWRLGVGELARIVADGAPRAIVVAGEWADLGRELATQVDVEHWLSYGPDCDGSY